MAMMSSGRIVIARMGYAGSHSVWRIALPVAQATAAQWADAAATNRRLLELGLSCARPSRAARGDRDEPARERVDSEGGVFVPLDEQTVLLAIGEAPH